MGHPTDNLYGMRKYPRRIKYEPGQKYSNFTILEEAPSVRSPTGYTYTCWKCLCDCGNVFTTTTKQIRKGIRKSCGCLAQRSRYKKVSTEQAISTVKFNHYRSAANRRQIEWKLTKEEFSNLIFKNCNYCGSEPLVEVRSNSHIKLVNGIDRVNSNGPYSIENCVPCCRYCNCAKGASSIEEFKEWIKKIKGL